MTEVTKCRHNESVSDFHTLSPKPRKHWLHLKTSMISHSTLLKQVRRKTKPDKRNLIDSAVDNVKCGHAKGVIVDALLSP